MNLEPSVDAAEISGYLAAYNLQLAKIGESLIINSQLEEVRYATKAMVLLALGRAEIQSSIDETSKYLAACSVEIASLSELLIERECFSESQAELRAAVLFATARAQLAEILYSTRNKNQFLASGEQKDYHV